MRILIVEDDTISRHILQKMLAHYGEIEVAANGADALDAFRLALIQRKPFQLVCLDVMMPEMNGYDVLRRIRAMEKDKDIPSDRRTKVLMTTALGDKGHVMEAIEAECDSYLLKPFDRQRLLVHLQKLGFTV